jgi:hypothetical protein
MSSESLHAPRARLSPETLGFHQAVASLIEELDAIDWYRQRAEDTEDETLRDLLLHNMREEMEHAAMLLEWLRRADREFAGFLRRHLFCDGAILSAQEAGTASETAAAPADPMPRFTIGSLREDEDRAWTT